jgi:hypothetical protein
MNKHIYKIYRFISLPIIFCGLSLLSPGIRAAQTLGSVTLQSVSPRIITPNGDGKNDVAFFNFGSADNLVGLPISGEIFDITGAKVSTFSVWSGDTTKMMWNGKDGSGNTLPSGIYIYQITLGGSKLTGTVVIAR